MRDNIKESNATCEGCRPVIETGRGAEEWTRRLEGEETAESKDPSASHAMFYTPSNYSEGASCTAPLAVGGRPLSKPVTAVA